MLPKNLKRTQQKKLLAAVILSDGYLHTAYGKTRGLRLETASDSEMQHKLFAELCRLCFNKQPKTYVQKVNSVQQKRLVSELYSRNAAKEIQKLVPCKTTPSSKETISQFLVREQPNLNFLKNEPAWLRWLAFRIFLDFDGSISPIFKLRCKNENKNAKIYTSYQVQFECEIRISETNPTLAESLVNLSQELGLRAHITKDQRMWSGIGGLIITEHKSVKKIIKRGPITDVFIHKGTNFRGISKRTICGAIMNFFELMKNRRSWHFKNKTDATICKAFLNKSFNKIINSPVV